MKKILIILSLILVKSMVFSQDIDLYNIKKDDNITSPKIPSTMSFNEFQLLSQNLRMKDMMYAIIVPGYVHFKAKENKTAYTLLTLRTASYIGLGTSYFSSKARGDKWYSGLINSKSDASNIQITEDWSIKKSDVVVVASMVTIFSTYLYDWIHGQYKLQKKQNMIRYKYGIKLKLEQNLSSNIKFSPALGLSVKF